MRDEEKKNGEISVKNSKFLTWLDNFWYHYKWVTIIAAFFIIVALVCIIQACTNESSDFIVTYAGSTYLSDDDKKSVENVLNNEFSDAITEEETLKIGLISYNVYTKEQIIALEKETTYDGDKKYSINTAVNSEQMSTFQNQLGTGSGSVLIMDKELYEFMFKVDGEAERLMPLSEIYGDMPEGAIDGYAIRLGDTDMYKNNRSIRCLPADTVICLHRKIVSQKQENYDREIIAFKEFTKVTG